MNMLLFSYPLLWVLSVLSAVFTGLAACSRRAGLFLLSGCALSALVLASLACMLPYYEILLLLVPACYAALLTGKKGGAE